MKTISRFFETLEQAENFMEELYDQYKSVTLISFPIVGSDGIYIWNVI
jgi:hypothetical protein